ncbi:MAG: glucosyl-3-phosphoglycerate synthase [Acidimicrobiales bacterium]|nr:glucosyl-3-phosphoglycerate synthase [Acidimicrobiales bacterium]
MSPESIRSFHHQEFEIDRLVSAKAGRMVAVCIPARNEEATIATIVGTIHRDLVVDHPLVDELVVVDDQSTDETAVVAAQAGARVVSTSDLLPHLAKGPGKGQALWKSLYATSSELIVWCDGDITDFDRRFVTGIVGPLLEHPDIGFVKGYYDRPIDSDRAGGGRVTELLARPLISVLFPHLSQLIQPLAGEYGGRRALLEQLPFASGYGVELGLLVDIAARFGDDCIAQVDLGQRRHRNRGLDELGPQAAAILHTALRRVAPDLVGSPRPLVRPGVEAVDIEVDEHPPMVTVSDYTRRFGLGEPPAGEIAQASE